VLAGDQFPNGYWVCSAYSNGSEDFRPLLSYVLRLCPFLPARGAPGVPQTDEQRAERAERRAEQERKRAEDRACERKWWLDRWDKAGWVMSDRETPVVLYLARRGLKLPPKVFRQATCTSKKRQGIAYEMMAEIVSPVTGDRLAYHVTYLDSSCHKTTEWRSDGKARITPGLTADRGVGVIKLVAGSRALCVGEGIETALSFTYIPEAKGATFWAGVTAANMAKIEPLDAFESIMVAVDIEPSGAGEKAGRELAARWAAAGKRALLLYPIPPEGRDKFDLNDVAQIEEGLVEGVNYRIELMDAYSDDIVIGHNSQEPYTELGNAHRLVHQHGRDIRYVHPLRSWFIWTGDYWRRDENGEIMRRGEATIESLFDEAKKISDEARRTALRKFALQSQARRQLENMVALAQHQRGVALSPDKLDADPMLLGVLNGVIDLKTGTLRRGRREDYITKRANVTFDASAQCPNWIAFQNKITGGDKELIAYKQRLHGLLLTGLMVEILFILHGDGNNGKTTEMETLHELLGDYAHAAGAGLLMPTKDQSGPKPEIVVLKGKRAVFINETGESAHLNESRVKYLSGNDTLYARDLHEKPINFRPTHKPLLRTNHKPIIRGTDLGIWRRINNVPYLVTITEEEKIVRFREDKLMPELPGILNWALAGLKQYLETGLQPPEAVCRALRNTAKKWIASSSGLKLR
jgi:P4 family phage/plasmid primase-like protien